MNRIDLKALLAGLLILSALAAPLKAHELGRLFFSADERRMMNQKRIAPIRETQPRVSPKLNSQPVAAIDATASVTLPPPKITGQVIRSSGNNTVWVNQTPNYRRSPSR